MNFIKAIKYLYDNPGAIISDQHGHVITIYNDYIIISGSEGILVQEVLLSKWKIHK
jgi:hypothetical protein